MKKQLLLLLTCIAFAPAIDAMQKQQLGLAYVDALSKNNTTKLFDAVYNNGQDVTDANLQEIRDLIAQGANPNKAQGSPYIDTPMVTAFIRLTQRGLNPDQVAKRLKVLKELLKNGAPVNTQRYNLGILVSNMPGYPEKQELLNIVKEYGLLK
jgi:hypothetical protein